MTTIDTMVSSESKRAPVPMRGWLIRVVEQPAQEIKAVVATKPVFSDLLKTKRLLIPASGHCEWHDAPCSS